MAKRNCVFCVRVALWLLGCFQQWRREKLIVANWQWHRKQFGSPISLCFVSGFRRWRISSLRCEKQTNNIEPKKKKPKEASETVNSIERKSVEEGKRVLWFECTWKRCENCDHRDRDRGAESSSIMFIKKTNVDVKKLTLKIQDGKKDTASRLRHLKTILGEWRMGRDSPCSTSALALHETNVIGSKIANGAH